MIKLLIDYFIAGIKIPTVILNYIKDRRKRVNCTVMEDVILYPACRISNKNNRINIKIGEYSRIHAFLETFGDEGRIEIGSYCFISEGTRVWSASSVTIGDRVLISHNVNIHDTNSHSISARERAMHFEHIFNIGYPEFSPNVPTSPIVIQDDVWIGFGASILKGVTIGEGAIVGAYSMVTKDVAPFTIVVGNPARVIGMATR